MAVEQESLVIGGVSLSDESIWWLRSLTNNPPARRAEWLDNPDSDGGILSRVPTLERMTIEAEVELVADVSRSVAFGHLQDLMETLAECERLIPGQWVTRTPAETDTTRLTYCQLAEITNLPVEKTGDLAGWLEGRPVLQIRMECVPYWLGTLTTGATVTNTDPIQTVNVTATGDIPAFGIVTYTDAATQDRSHVEIGCDHTTDTARSYLIDSAAMTALGGTASTESGAYSASGTIAASLVSTPLAICGYTHDDVGTFKTKVRAKETTATATGTISLRVDHRAADGPFSEGSWVTLGTGDFYELDLGLVDFDEAPLGTQSGEWRIVGKATTLSTVEIDYAILMPQSFYGLARSPLEIPTPTALSVSDTFDQSAGSLNGKSLPTPSGQTWATSGSATDLALSGSGLLTRSTVSDGAARFAVAGSATYADVVVSSHLSFSSLDETGPYIGPMARYNSATDFVALRIEGYYALQLSTGTTVAKSVPIAFEANRRYELQLMLVGSKAIGFVDGEPVLVYDGLTGSYSDAGGVGLYDYHPGSNPMTRTYYEFAAWTPTLDSALYASRSLEIHHDRCLRESDAGGTYGRPPIYRGGYAVLPPGLNRVVGKARRNDIAELPDPNIADSGTLAVDFLPRWTVPA